MWKYFCVDCGGKVTRKEHKRCRKCRNIFLQDPKNNSNYKNGITKNAKCKRCNKKIRYATYKYSKGLCKSCVQIKEKIKYYCKCGAEKLKRSMFCYKCAMLNRWKTIWLAKIPPKKHCKCGKEIDQSSIRCRQCLLKLRKTDITVNPCYYLSQKKRNSRRRYYLHYRKILQSIFKFYHYKCVVCGDNFKLQAHHLEGRHWCISLREDKNNLICLCRKCHRAFHKKFSTYYNTTEQFINFIFGE